MRVELRRVEDIKTSGYTLLRFVAHNSHKEFVGQLMIRIVKYELPQIVRVEVAPPYRRQKLGTQLYYAAAEYCREDLKSDFISEVEQTPETTSFWEKQIAIGHAQKYQLRRQLVYRFLTESLANVEAMAPVQRQAA